MSSQEIKIKNALISVYHKENLELIIQELIRLKVNLYSTGGTKEYIEKYGVKVIAIEDITSYPSILGGRVKTLHPKVFGGILARRDNTEDLQEVKKYEIPLFDLIIVDLYPFESSVKSNASEKEIVEKIDIGGISLIRAAAKNFNEVLVTPSQDEYPALLKLLQDHNGITSVDDRKNFAIKAFSVSSRYDTVIHNYFNKEAEILHLNGKGSKPLRYGENPHQKGFFYGDLSEAFTQLFGKEISYNNLLDIDASIKLIAEFNEPTFAIIKHNNACGIASCETLVDAWKSALAGDPVSAFGGIIICNRSVDEVVAKQVDTLFFEIIIAPAYNEQSLKILQQKKNRIILLQNPVKLPVREFKTLLHGVIVQDKDLTVETINDIKTVTLKLPADTEKNDLVFANKIVKHTKSNAIVLVKNKQLLGSGTGQTSRVDALLQAIAKAKNFNNELNGAVMASDAFFPFPDCVEIAHKAGITAIVQPGGSKKDQDSIDYCNKNGVSMVFTGIRHFKH